MIIDFVVNVYFYIYFERGMYKFINIIKLNY